MMEILQRKCRDGSTVFIISKEDSKKLRAADRSAYEKRIKRRTWYRGVRSLD